MNMKMTLGSLPSPLGALLVACDEAGCVRGLEFSGRRARLHRNLREHYGSYTLADAAAPAVVAHALRRYFDGDHAAIEEVEVRTAGTPFQERTWAQLRAIPAGCTRTYGEIGKAAGIADWRSAIGAGAAIGANPVAILVPCHRVIGAAGNLKGYAWGLHRKQWLLEHEHALPAAVAGPEMASLF
jgi:methylated-DNA-[protein]-cysteine S-methyltransferase